MSGKKIRTKAMAAAVGSMMLLSCIACGNDSVSMDLTIGMQAVCTEKVDLDDTSYVASIADFSVDFFRQTMNGKENMMVSPVSLLTALSMTENGAKGKTLSQIQKLCPNKKEGYAWLKRAEKQSKNTFTTANSIWIRNDKEQFQVNSEFLDKNAKTVNAEIYSADFKQDTVDDINHWVKKNTKGMIPKLIDKIEENEMMHLINTVAFDGKWEEKYESEDVSEDTFTNVDGEKAKVDFLHSEEGSYLKDDKAVGVIKSYKNGFSFVAILPNEGISLDSYMKAMTGKKFIGLIENADSIKVQTTIPKFKSEYMLQGSDILKKMGVKDPFDPAKADFTGIGTVKDGNLSIDSVVQKTYIEVDEKGTKASGATDISMTSGCAPCDERVEIVELNRPFIYAIIEDDTSLPVFMGAVTNM